MINKPRICEYVTLLCEV